MHSHVTIHSRSIVNDWDHRKKYRLKVAPNNRTPHHREFSSSQGMLLSLVGIYTKRDREGESQRRRWQLHGMMPLLIHILTDRGITKFKCSKWLSLFCNLYDKGMLYLHTHTHIAALKVQYHRPEVFRSQNPNSNNLNGRTVDGIGNNLKMFC